MLWKSEKKQTWSATGYLHMMFCDIVGMRFEKQGISFNPYVPQNINNIEVGDICVRSCNINIRISGNGRHLKSFMVNGKETENFVRFDGDKDIVIIME